MRSYHKLSRGESPVHSSALFNNIFVRIGFSSVLHLKKKYRNRLNPSNYLRSSLSNCVPRYARPAKPIRFSYLTIAFSFQKLAGKTADRKRKAQITALCCTPPVHRPLNSSIMHRGAVAILLIPELFQVPELTGRDCLHFADIYRQGPIQW